ncbi:mucin-like protein [Clavelina lepadiformis]|uniref:mucin-like protein n=1 Tax=Clavelina lepadiformis TaxID=159417 RepID=UPI004042390D
MLFLLSGILSALIATISLCKASYTWDDHPCGKPLQGRHSVYTKETDETGVTYVAYACKPSYEVEKGHNTSHCLKNKTWSGEPLICRDHALQAKRQTILYKPTSPKRLMFFCTDGLNCRNSHDPCKNNGTCVELDPSFDCQCQGKFYGSLCEIANGNWGAWMEWSNCTSTCNAGIRIKRRECNNPAPTSKGQMCIGPAMQTTPCHPRDCVNGTYSWCENDSDRCGQQADKAVCSIYEESYRCTCLEGVVEKWDEDDNFIRCEDIDECSNRMHSCDVMHAICINTFGSYTCTCKSGFTGDGNSCIDIDECRDNSHNCDINSRCYNKEGSYMCKCREGFQSRAKNRTGYVGECVDHVSFKYKINNQNVIVLESRLISYGKEANDKLVKSVSRGTGERVSEILEIPSGIALEDGASNRFTCKSIYVSENGVVVITNLRQATDTERKPSFRNPVDIIAGQNNTEGFIPYGNNTCALLAIFWADTNSSHGRIWYHVYNMHDVNKTVNSSRDHSFLKQITETFKDFDPNFVVVITWDKMKPPWQSISEEMTFQMLLATDGTRTVVANLYEESFLTWKPVFNVPHDIPKYPAVSGYVVKGKIPKKWQHPWSGLWNIDNSKPNIYRIHQAKFNTTKKAGQYTYDLTPGYDKSSAGVKCYQWYKKQTEIKSEIAERVSSCPPSLGYLKLQENVTWIKIEENVNVICYRWKFKFDTGGSFDCCYKTFNNMTSLINGKNAITRGTGLYVVDYANDQMMKDICCQRTQSNYFCSLFAERRPPTSSRRYEPPYTASGIAGVHFTAINGNTTQIKKPGEHPLLDGEGVLMIGTINDQKLTAISLSADNLTLEFVASDNGLNCIIDGIICKHATLSTKQVYFTSDWIGVATRKGRHHITDLTSFNYIHTENVLFFTKSTLLNDFQHIPHYTYTETTKINYYKVFRNFKIKEKEGLIYMLRSYLTGAFIKVMLVKDGLEFVIQLPKSVLSGDATGILSKQGESSDVPQNISPEFYSTELMYFSPHHNQSDNYKSENKTDYYSLGYGKAKIIAEKTLAEDFQVNIDINQIDGETIVANWNGAVKRRPGNLFLRSPSAKLIENLILAVIDKTADRPVVSLIFPDIFICTCTSINGRCPTDIPHTKYTGPFTTYLDCVCNAGYVGSNCDEALLPCRENPCFSGVDCKSNFNSLDDGKQRISKDYRCGKCPSVFTSGNGETCFYENPCLKKSFTQGGHKCQEAKCVHEPGRYSCICNKGFRTKINSNTTCKDINECDGNHSCDKKHGKCENTPGSYRCSCNVGFTMKDGGCVDRNECLHDNGGCQRRCHNTVGSFRCSCEPGYKLQKDNKNCKEINECDEYARDHCQQICSDNRTGKPFYCTCLHRYRLMQNYADCEALFSERVTTTVLTPTALPKFVRPTHKTTSNVMPTSTTEPLGAITTVTTQATTRQTQTTEKVTSTAIRNSISTRELATSVARPIFTEIASTTAPLYVEYMEGIDELLKNWLLKFLKTSSLSRKDQIAFIDLILSVSFLFEDDDLAFLLQLSCNLNLEEESCASLETKFKQNGLSMSILNLHKRFLRKFISLKQHIDVDLNSLFFSSQLQCPGLTLKSLSKIIGFIFNCVQSGLYIFAEETVIERRETKDDAPSLIITTHAASTVTEQMMVMPPLVFAWITALVVLCAIGLFVVLILGTRYCFPWHKEKVLARETKKKHMMRESWPRVVSSQ